MVNYSLSKDKILAWSSIPLPGKKAQDIMIPHPDRNNYIIPKSYKKAAVMILLFEQNKEWGFVLIQRTHHPKDKHAGQISLPGGQLDLMDNQDLIQCSLRETEEEIGIPQSIIQHVSSLTPIYVPVSGFMVYPQVGLFEGDLSDFSKQDDEVEKIIFSSLRLLMEEKTMQYKTLEIKNKVLPKVPYYNINNHVVWGATAMILSEFKEWIR